MANQPTYSTTIPVTGAGLGGHLHTGGSSSHGNITISGAGNSGPTYSMGTVTGTNWVTTASANPWSSQGKIEITDKDIKLDGWSLRETLQTINERLAVLQPNPALEKEFDELRACADRYRELEKKFLDQKVMWETLKNE
jgi:hypothetical protein